MKNIKNSIVESADIDPQSLDLHELNWRIHTAEQKKALGEALEKIGWVQRVVVNKNTNKIIDGHLRVAVARARGEATVPVNYVDLTQAEERLALATFDPIGSLAFGDKPALKALLASLTETDEAVKAMLNQTAIDAGVTKPPKKGDDGEPIPEKKARPRTAIEVYAVINTDNSHCCSAARAGLLYATEDRPVLCRTHALALYMPQILTSQMVKRTKALRYAIRCEKVGAAELQLASEIIESGAEPVFMPKTAPDNLPDNAVIAYDVDASPYDIKLINKYSVLLASASCEKLLGAIGDKENIIGVITSEPEVAANKGELMMWKWRADNGHLITRPDAKPTSPTVEGIGFHVPNPAVIAFAINASTANIAFRDWASDMIPALGNS